MKMVAITAVLAALRAGLLLLAGSNITALQVRAATVDVGPADYGLYAVLPLAGAAVLWLAGLLCRGFSILSPTISTSQKRLGKIAQSYAASGDVEGLKLLQGLIELEANRK